MGDYKKLFLEEIKQFIFLTSEQDANILVSKYKKKNMPEFVRLACIAMAFGFKRVFFKIAATVEKDLDSFIKGVDSLNGNFGLMDKWINDFIDRIDVKEVRDLSREYWENTKPLLDKDNFSIRQFN